MIAQDETSVKPILAGDDQEAVLIGEEWHLPTCPGPCVVENDRQEAAVEANLLAQIQEATAGRKWARQSG